MNKIRKITFGNIVGKRPEKKDGKKNGRERIRSKKRKSRDWSKKISNYGLFPLFCIMRFKIKIRVTISQITPRRNYLLDFNQ